MDGDHIDAQNERNEAARHPERNRSAEDVLKNTKTCPEETILQLGNIDGTIPASTFAQISAEYFEEFEKRFGSHIHILDWALHLSLLPLKSSQLLKQLTQVLTRQAMKKIKLLVLSQFRKF